MPSWSVPHALRSGDEQVRPSRPSDATNPTTGDTKAGYCRRCKGDATVLHSQFWLIMPTLCRNVFDLADGRFPGEDNSYCT